MIKKDALLKSTKEYLQSMHKMYTINPIVKSFLKLIIPMSLRPYLRRTYMKLTAKSNFLKLIKLEYGKNILNNLAPETLKLFEAKLKDYADKYENLTFGICHMRSIGEMSLTFHIFLSEKDQKRKKLYVILPVMFVKENKKLIVNNLLYSKIKEHMEIIDEDNAAFWFWVMTKNRQLKIDYTESFLGYMTVYKSMNYPYANVTPKFSLSEGIEAKKRITDMHLREPFICLFSRDNAYCRDESSYGSKKLDENVLFNVRNSSIKNLYLTARNISKKNIQCVRVGSIVEEATQCDNLIDYASYYRTELMDLYLIANCKFFVVSASGIMLLATLYGKATVVHNLPFISFAGDMAMPLSPERDIILMKKVWYKPENRYLTLQDILNIENKYKDKGYYLFDEYKKMGCEFIENTPEEIWNAVNEMNQRLDGTISYTDEELEAQKRYLHIVYTTTAKNKILFYDGMYSTNFLVNNPWFLQ